MKTGVAYFHTRDPIHVARDLDDMLEHGVNFVVHCFSELDMAFYNKAMEKIVRMSKDRGMEVYFDPWGLGGVYGGEAFSRFVAQNHSAKQVNSQGLPVAAACPNNPLFIEFQKKWIKRAGDLGADVCFWDEPHFNLNFLDRDSWGKVWSCRCETCQALFKDQYGANMPPTLNQEVTAFREQSLLKFLDDMCIEARSMGMKNSVCVLPDEGGRLGLAAGTGSWESIAGLESVDIFGTDPYWLLFGKEVTSYVGSMSKRVIELCTKYNKEPQAWVLAFLIPEGREEEVGQAVDVMYESGIRNIAAWGFKGCQFIDISCQNPEKVWQILGKAYNRVRNLNK